MGRTVRSAGRLAAAVTLLVVTAASALAIRAVADRDGVRFRAPTSFSIDGGVKGLMRPGSRRPIRLILTNRNTFALRVTHLHVKGQVDSIHRAAGCAMRRDYRIRQTSKRVNFVLPARSRRTLRQLSVKRRPALRFINDPLRDQDACKGAKVFMRFHANSIPLRPTAVFESAS